MQTKTESFVVCLLKTQTEGRHTRIKQKVFLTKKCRYAWPSLVGHSLQWQHNTTRHDKTENKDIYKNAMPISP